MSGTQAGLGFRSLAKGCWHPHPGAPCFLLLQVEQQPRASSEKSSWEKSTEQKGVLGGLSSCWHSQLRGLEDSSLEGKVGVKQGQQECAGTHGPELEPTRMHWTCAHTMVTGCFSRC